MASSQVAISEARISPSNDVIVREHRERSNAVINVHAQRAATTILARLTKPLSKRLSVEGLAQIIAEEFKTEVTNVRT
jgi:hypothetical protein